MLRECKEIQEDEYKRIEGLLNKINFLEAEDINDKYRSVKAEAGMRLSDVKGMQILKRGDMNMLMGLEVE